MVKLMKKIKKDKIYLSVFGEKRDESKRDGYIYSYGNSSKSYRYVTDIPLTDEQMKRQELHLLSQTLESILK